MQLNRCLIVTFVTLKFTKRSIYFELKDQMTLNERGDQAAASLSLFNNSSSSDITNGARVQGTANFAEFNDSSGTLECPNSMRSTKIILNVREAAA